MKRILMSSLLLTLSAPILNADFLRIVPPAPDSNDSIEAVMGGSWHDGCAPGSPEVSIDGNEISIALSVRTKNCPAVITAWRADATFGPLEPGFYTLNVFLPLEDPSTPTLWKTMKFPVTEADVEYEVLPSAGPVTGGYEITILGQFGECLETPCSMPEVTFDGVPATSLREVPLGVAVGVPPHTEGTADIGLTGRGGADLRTISAGFYYFEPSSTPDPAAFKPFLFPVFFEGPGALGSVWTTDAWVYNRGETPVIPLNPGTILFCPPDDEPCRTAFPEKEALRIEHGPDRRDLGLLLYVPRSQAEYLDFSLHIRDLSRQAESAGTSIPVISEEDLEEDFIQLLNVPVAERFRQTLRVFTLEENRGARVQVQAFPMTGETESLGLVELTLAGSPDCEGDNCPPLEPAAAVLSDLRAAFPDLGEVDRIRLDIRPIEESLRLWGFVSITNNDTQQVTTVTPH